MPYIPRQVRSDLLSAKLFDRLDAPRQGKVRDTYWLDDKVLLVVATDRISIFDFVLGTLVKDKGAILTAMTVFWLTTVLKNWRHHLLAYGQEIDKYLPEDLRSNPELQRRALIVKKLDMIPVECIIRSHLTGSGWLSYEKNGEVCGHQLEAGLHDGSKLPFNVFTPTTKAEIGHDEDLPASEVIAKYGQELSMASLQVFGFASVYAKQRGIIIADTKFEFGKGNGQFSAYVLADEVLTPDSSRFWLQRDVEALPVFYLC